MNKWVVILALFFAILLLYLFLGDRQVTSGNAEESYPSFSPDGKNIVFVSNKSGSHDIWIMGRDGKNQIRLIEWDSEETYPAWSPDGKNIAFTSDKSGNMSIWILNLSNMEYRQLTSGSASWYPSFSYNGRLVAYSSFEPASRGSAIWIIDITKGQQIQLTQGRSLDRGPAFSSDGNRVAFHSGNDKDELWVINTDGSNLTQLMFSDSNVWGAAWSPDGKSIAFTSEVNGRSDIWVMELSSGKKRQVTSGGNDMRPSWSPDGRQIVFHRSGDIWIAGV
ncbi:MAG: hypothetical protein FIB08_14655 [Candidatus Methanoperedens sp.]|nr:hypothetical protein [Candidatus Methanoperedens sp.]